MYDTEPAVVPVVVPEPDYGICEGPACGLRMTSEPWECATTPEGDGEDGRHSFCSKGCLEQWMTEDQAKRAAELARRD
jgi:hypothetical protein